MGVHKSIDAMLLSMYDTEYITNNGVRSRVHRMHTNSAFGYLILQFFFAIHALDHVEWTV